ncbi:MAG: hypothetical protein ACR2LI_10020 [Propionibacteriaceae bacterium]
MVGPLILATLVLVAGLVGLVVLVVRLARSTPLAAPPPQPASPLSAAQTRPYVDRALRQARLRALVCVGVAAVALVVGLRIEALRPDLLGLPSALTPGLAAAVALLVYAWLPTPPSAVESGGTVSAPLTPRSATSFGTRAVFTVPTAVAVVFLGFLAWAGAVAGPDELGRFREFPLSGRDWSAAAGPFPGSYYGLPLAGVTVLLAAATLAALRRVALTPVLPVAGLDLVDRAWREVSTRIIVRISTAALLGYVGGSLLFAGGAIRSASSTAFLTTGHRSILEPAGVVLLGCGLLTVVAGVAVAMLAVLAAVTLRSALPMAVAGTPRAAVTGPPTSR